MSTKVASNPAPNASPEAQIQEFMDIAQRAVALRKFESAVENYANALEIFTAKHGDNSPESADLLFKYGKALLENAMEQNAVLGKEGAPVEATAVNGVSKDAAIDGKIHFEGDMDEDEEEESDEDDEEDEAMEDAEALKLSDVGKEEGEEKTEDEEMADVEPEDDFNAAWEVLDLARSLYEKKNDNQSKLKLAETYIALGDVSLETEKFDQAASDYSSALTLKTALLPKWSRQITEVHFKLSMVSDLSLGRLSDAIEHAELARQSLDARLVLLHEAEVAKEGGAAPTTNGTIDQEPMASAERNVIAQMSKEELAAEIKEVEGLRKDVSNKVDDLSAAPDIDESAPDAANRALDELLGGPTASIAGAPVNDLTGMVKKKKVVREETTEVEATNGTAH